MKKTFNDFTRSYSLSKTLRFELIPVGNTVDNIINSGLLDEDTHRAESYKVVKKLIDEYHKAFIDRVLSSFKIPVISENKKNSLEEYIAAYHAKQHDDNAKALFETVGKNMRKMIAQKLSKDEYFNRLFQKELIREDLIHFIQTACPEQLNGLDKEQATQLIDEFKEFTTYFQGFHKNRKNMYSEENQTTAISHRLINENLPRFIDNMAVFVKLSSIPELQGKIEELLHQFESHLNVASITEMFRLEYYNVLLTQTQIDVYNSIIGGLNEYINLYNQQHKDLRLPKLKVLYKQILSDRNSNSWLPEEFKSDNETLQAIKDFYEELEASILGEKSLKLLLESLAGYNLDGIYVRNDLQLTEVSQKTFGNWSIIPNAIKEKIKETAPAQKKREDNEQYEERINSLFKKQDSFSIQYINDCITFSYPNEQHTIQGYYANLGAVNNETEQRENLFYQIANRYAEVKELLSVPYPKGCNLAQDKINIEKIKELLDAIKSLQHFIKPLLGAGNESYKDETFYGELSHLWTQLDQVTPLYNKVRNYLTRKPYSQEKIKLNFRNSTLLDGWDENKECDNSSIILRKGDDYFLGIMHKDYRKMLKKEWPSDGECFEKMVYKFVPDPRKQLPHVYFSKKGIAIYKPQSEILEIKATKTHTKGENFSLKDCHTLIDFFKSSINRHEDWKQFGFHFSETSSYHDISEFYKEVEQQGYKITYRDVSVAFVNQLVEEGKLFLFKIYNKDFSPHSKGTPNMHTLYWRALFSERNLNDVVYKLNGKAEVFYRKHSLTYTHPTHPANQPIKNKNKDNDKKESIFKYDLIKDRRYTIDKYMLHIPITMNFKCKDSVDINMEVREYLKNNNDCHIIGVDRGERHLLYLTVIDSQGHIIEQCSLNEIINEYNGNTYKTNYHQLLEEKEGQRREARQSWQTIETIKELKEGYLSQVIHKIVQLMIKYKAIVVLEDLNLGFMRGRQKVEKQVYQKFEQMLIDKLCYVVDKKADKEQPGGLYNAYQLAIPEAKGKQNGLLFYIPAWNTSKIDPVTGFVNLLDTRFESIEKTKAFFSKFKIIRYNIQRGWYEFVVDYNAFTAKAEGTRTQWVICSQGERIETFRNPNKNNQWDSRTVCPTEQLHQLFDEYHIDCTGNLKEAISMQTQKAFFETMMHILKHILQMRNSVTGSEIDYLISPVADENGNFYDSRTCDKSLPENADANGAFNIARKGLMIVQQIKHASDLTQLKLNLSNKSWLNFAQQKPYLND